MKIRCPWCQSMHRRLETLLGQLGRLAHFRCRFCGGDFSKEVR